MFVRERAARIQMYTSNRCVLSNKNDCILPIPSMISLFPLSTLTKTRKKKSQRSYTTDNNNNSQKKRINKLFAMELCSARIAAANRKNCISKYLFDTFDLCSQFIISKYIIVVSSLMFLASSISIFPVCMDSVDGFFSSSFYYIFPKCCTFLLREKGGRGGRNGKSNYHSNLFYTQKRPISVMQIIEHSQHFLYIYIYEYIFSSLCVFFALSLSFSISLFLFLCSSSPTTYI